MNCGITRWNPEPSYPNPFSPVANARKFSAVVEAVSLTYLQGHLLRQANLGHSLAIETHDNPPNLLISMLDVEKDLEHMWSAIASNNVIQGECAPCW